jgi:hypothetical protein
MSCLSKKGHRSCRLDLAHSSLDFRGRGPRAWRQVDTEVVGGESNCTGGFGTKNAHHG